MIFRKKIALGLAAATALGFVLTMGLSRPALGADADNLNVSAYVVANCEVVANPLSFGNYTQGGASNVDVTTTINVTCSGSTGWTVDANGGQNPSAGTRRMKHSVLNEYLTYKLATTSGYTTAFGTGETGGVTSGGTGTTNITVHGRIPGLQTPSAGNYSDVVLVTLTP